MLKKIKNIGFIAFETIIYVFFLALDIAKKDSMGIKYFGIVLCFLFALSNAFRGKNCLTLSLALLFTLIADWFLLVKNDNYVFGVCSFIVVQAIYFVRLIDDGVSFKRSGIIRAFAIAVVISILYVLELLDILTFVVSIYFVNLVLNAVDGYTLFSKSTKNKLFAIGMTLFIFCDLSVGLNNLSSYADVSKIATFIKIASFAMWVFYLPSQVLIALSGKGENNGNKK